MNAVMLNFPDFATAQTELERTSCASSQIIGALNALIGEDDEGNPIYQTFTGVFASVLLGVGANVPAEIQAYVVPQESWMPQWAVGP